MVRILPCMKGKQHQDENCTGPTFGCRHIQTCMYFLLLTYTYCMRSVLSVAIVSMNGEKSSENPDIPVYHWDNGSVVLSSIFWGYVILQVPVAQLGKKLGPKWLLVACSAVDSTACILIPIVSEHFGSYGVMVCRFFEGLAQGGIMPMVHMLLGQWAPPSERSVLGTFAYSGSILGNIISLPVTGFLCSSWLGWPSAFYLFGALGIKWNILWIIFGSNKPACHRSITKCERKYIESSLGQQDHEKKHDTPWGDILLSPPFWAVTLAFVGANWGSSVLLTQTPTYLSKILKYDIKSNSLLSAAPYVAMFLGSIIFSSICDWLINNHIVKRGTARKIFNAIGTIGPAIILSTVGFIPKSKATISVFILIINGALTSAGMCSYQVNHMDLSPNHAGILMGITNGSTGFFSILSPLIVQFIVTGEQTDQTEWRSIFLITAVIYVCTAIVYTCFASGEVQKWNSKSPENVSIKSKDAADVIHTVYVIS